MVTVDATLGKPPVRSGREPRTGRGAFGILFAPVTLLIVFFLAPMAIMGSMSLLRFPPNTASGFTLQHYVDVLTDPLNLKIAWTTALIGTSAMAVMLAIAMPLAYYMTFKAGRWELFILLALVLADELAPVVKIYAWQVILGREGIVNWLIPGPPVEWLIYSRFAVVVTLAATYITYTTIPIYAAMKAIDASMFESAVDLGANWWVQARRILIPLAAPGIFIAMILVYIPMLTDFVTADIVGGTGSYMMGQRVRDLILSQGDWGAGSALNLILLVLSVVFSLLAYRLGRLHRIET
jgi:spermidine/putrescine transport system permease protein